jgi:hypothetical protein
MTTTLGNLALARREFGDLNEAQDLVMRAIVILDTAVEPDHPTLVNCRQLEAGLNLSSADDGRKEDRHAGGIAK